MLAAAGCRLLLRTRDTEWIGTYFALLIGQWRSQLSHFHRVSTFRCSHRDLEIVEVWVEVDLSREELDWRVLTAEFDEGLGGITCERALLGQSAKDETSLRSGAGFADSTQWCLCRKWCGAE